MDAINWAQLNWADYIILALIVFSTIISSVRGFVKEAISLATWIVAAFVALKFSGQLAAVFEQYIETPSLRSVIAFSILFVATITIGGVLNHILTTLIYRTGLSGTDRVLGMFFGIARGILLMGVLVLLGQMTQLPEDNWWKTSQLIPQFLPLAHWLQGFLPEQLNQLSGSLTTTVAQVQEASTHY